MTNLVLNTQNSTPYNTAINTSNNYPQMMSSKEVASLTGKEHRNVIRDIREMIDQLDDSNLSHEEYQQLTDCRGYTSEILLNKDLTTCLVSGYNVQLRMAIIKRWNELEAQQAFALPTTFSQALLLAAQLEEQKEQLALQVSQQQQVIEIQAPKAEVFDAVLDKSRTYSIREFAQHTGVKEKAIKEWIVEKRWATGHDAKTFRPASWSNQHNYMRMMRTGKPFTNAWGCICYNEVIVFTQQGHDEAVRKMVKSGMMKPLAESVVQFDNYQLQA